MTIIDYITFFIIFILAILLGYFLHKALQAEKLRNLHQQISEANELKTHLAVSQRSVTNLKQETLETSQKEEKIRNDFYRLTLSYKNLQEQLQNRQAELDKQYDVPPELPLLKESNKLLAAEIEKLRKKLSKWKSKDFQKKNIKLQKKLNTANKELAQLKDKKSQVKRLKKYEAIIEKMKALSDEASQLIILKEEEEESLGIFKHQPSVRKDKIFNEIISSIQAVKPNNKIIEPVFDLEDEKEKNLMDLIGINSQIYALLLHHNISTFENLADVSIKELKTIIKSSSLNHKEHHYSSWPTQARLAIDGEWELINEYLS